MGMKPRRPSLPSLAVVPKVTPPTSLPPAPDAFEAAIALAREKLTLAIQAAPMQREPYKIILAAQSSTLDVFDKVTTRWEKAVTDVIAARDPLPSDEKAALVQELVAATKQGAYEAMRKEAARMMRRLDGSLSVRIGLAVGAAYVAGALSVWAFVLL